jgi:hypothetical protein
MRNPQRFCTRITRLFGEPSGAGRFKVGDLIGVRERDADVIKTVQESMLILWFHRERLG